MKTFIPKITPHELKAASARLLANLIGDRYALDHPATARVTRGWVSQPKRGND